MTNVCKRHCVHPVQHMPPDRIVTTGLQTHKNLWPERVNHRKYYNGLPACNHRTKYKKPQAANHVVNGNITTESPGVASSHEETRIVHALRNPRGAFLLNLRNPNDIIE